MKASMLGPGMFLQTALLATVAWGLVGVAASHLGASHPAAKRTARPILAQWSWHRSPTSPDGTVAEAGVASARAPGPD